MCRKIGSQFSPHVLHICYGQREVPCGSRFSTFYLICEQISIPAVGNAAVLYHLCGHVHPTPKLVYVCGGTIGTCNP